MMLRRSCDRQNPSRRLYSAVAAWNSNRNAASPYRLLPLLSPRRSAVFRNTVLASTKGNNNFQLQRNVSSDSYGDGGGYGRPVVQWYPGHIAKAERALAVTMKAVDVVVEVRDARLPAATAHPSVESQQWCHNKPRVIVLTHADAIPRRAHTAWQNALRRANRIPIPPTRGKNATGIMRLDDTGSANPNRMIQSVAAQVESVRINYTPNNSSSALAKKKKKASSSKSSFQPQKLNAVPAQAVCFVNAKQGAGVFRLIRAIGAAGQAVQDRRIARGLLGRPLRVGVLGYPNVGKSALINRLIGRRRCRTANTPGVTRSLQWIRVRHGEPGSSKDTSRFPEFELLDSPGIIPAVLADQSDAMLLAACNCIGEAAYDNQAVAAYLCEWLLAVHRLGFQQLVAPYWRNRCIERYRVDPLDPQPRDIHQQHERVTGEDILYLVADNTCQGDPEDAARKILQDFRTGRMGPFCLQVAPSPVDELSQEPVSRQYKVDSRNDPENLVWQIEQQKREQQAVTALAMAKATGLALPPAMVQANATTTSIATDDSKNQSKTSLIGKGLFEGW
jgi:ribosome biogenesis GTPase A